MVLLVLWSSTPQKTNKNNCFIGFMVLDTTKNQKNNRKTKKNKANM